MPDAMQAAYAGRNAKRPMHERTDERTYREPWSPGIDISPSVTRTHRREGGCRRMDFEDSQREQVAA